ncbi:MAG: ferritin family protein [Candidatus Micrarchaeia archaeon]
MFKEFFGSESVEVVKGVRIAIELEKESIKYYNEKSKKMESKDAAKLLKFIEKEEMNHLKQLELLKESLLKKKAWLSADKLGKPAGPALYKEGKTPAVKGDSLDVGILLGAARAEREAKEFYEKFAEKIKDEEGRRFFMRLAEFEQSHYELFDGILQASEVKVEGGDLI